MTRGPARSMSLSLKRARVCLDCDCLTDEQSLSRCDRGATVPLAGWFRPSRTTSQRDASGEELSPVARQWILIVQHHQRDLYRVLREALDGNRRGGASTTGASASAAGSPPARRPTSNAGLTADARGRARPCTRTSAGAAKPESPSRPRRDRETVPVIRPRRRQPTAI